MNVSSGIIAPAGENFIQIDEESPFPVILNLQVVGESTLRGVEVEGEKEKKEGAFHFVLTPLDNPSSQAISGGVVVGDEGGVRGVGVGGWFGGVVGVLEGVRGHVGGEVGGGGELFGLFGGWKEEKVISMGYGDVGEYEEVCL